MSDINRLVLEANLVPKSYQSGGTAPSRTPNYNTSSSGNRMAGKIGAGILGTGLVAGGLKVASGLKNSMGSIHSARQHALDLAGQ